MNPQALVLPEMFTWSAAIFALTIVAMGARQEILVTRLITLLTKVAAVKDIVEETKMMHEHPDDYGFGTKETNQLLKQMAVLQTENSEQLKDTRQSIDELVHAIRVDFANRNDGTQIPPKLPGG